MATRSRTASSSVAELDWLADIGSWRQRDQPALCHPPVADRGEALTTNATPVSVLRDAPVAATRQKGFVPNVRKTRVMPRGVCQHVTGLVVNSHPNLDRAEFDRLKATLTNCARHGPASQNRAGVAQFRSHLLGAWHFANRSTRREARSIDAFKAIDWQPR